MSALEASELRPALPRAEDRRPDQPSEQTQPAGPMRLDMQLQQARSCSSNGAIITIKSWP